MWDKHQIYALHAEFCQKNSTIPNKYQLMHVGVMKTQGGKCVDSRTAGDYLVFAGIMVTCSGHTHVIHNTTHGHTQQAGKSKLGLVAITGSHKQSRTRLSRVKTNNTSQRHKLNELN